MPLREGEDLAHYTLIGRIGEGGMGVVWRARDTRLDREVAIKVLPEAFAADAERLRRLEREAKAVAALNHPNIVTLHSVEEAGGVRFLTLELVDGETLAHRIPAGGMPLEALLDLALPLADAIEAAHRKGVTHHDLKPANVMITDEGRVKVLDFGLARLRQPVSAEQSHEAPTRTDPGRIAGTPAYMAPELIQGREVDHRADIFACGAILYEMATGRRPFAGNTPVEVAAAILRDSPPDPAALRPGLPRQLGTIVGRCLEKEPQRRFQSAQELREALAALAATQNLAAAPRRGWLALVAAIVLVAAVAVVLVGRRRPAPAPPAPAALTQLTFAPGVEEFAALSPDGSRLAFSAERDGMRKIFVKELPEGAERQLTHGEHDDIQPAWSPDGATLFFVRSTEPGRRVGLSDPFATSSDGGLWAIDVGEEAAGREEKLVDEAFNPAVSPDGETIAVDAAWVGPHRIWLLDRRGRNPRQLTQGETEAVEHVRPAWSPDGGKLAFQHIERTKFDVRVVDVATEKTFTVTDDPVQDLNPVWSPGGDALYFSSYRGGGMNVWRIPVDSDGRPAGRMSQVTTGAGQDVGLAVAPAARTLAFTILEQNADLWRLPVDPATGLPGGGPEELVATTREDGRGSWSPDGRRIAFNSDRAGSMNIWVHDLDDGTTRRLTEGEGGDYQPTWSPDGSSIAFFSSRAGSPDIWLVDVASGELTRLTLDDAVDINPFWSPDGTRIAYHSDRGGRMEVWVVGADGSDPHPVTDAGVQPSHFMVWTQGGAGLLFRCLCGGEPSVAELDLGSGALRKLPHVAGGGHLSVSPDGSRIMDAQNHRVLWVSPLEPGEPQDVFELDDPSIRIDYPSWSPDGRWVLFERQRHRQGDVFSIPVD